jgi:hypothetical protein
MEQCVQTKTGISTTAATGRPFLVPASASLLLLAGCAGTKIDNLAMTPTNAPTPRMLLVDVDVAPGMEGQPLAREAAGKLQAKLLERYAREGVTVAAADGRSNRPTAAVLRVKIDRAEGGNKLKAFAIGFGAGSSSLRTSAVLEVPGTRGPALRFDSRTTANLRPGFILPGGIAAATGETAGLPISAGLGLFSVTRTGLGRDVDRSAKRIVAETKDHYVRVGWTWPRA